MSSLTAGVVCGLVAVPLIALGLVVGSKLALSLREVLNTLTFLGAIYAITGTMIAFFLLVAFKIVGGLRKQNIELSAFVAAGILVPVPPSIWFVIELGGLPGLLGSPTAAAVQTIAIHSVAGGVSAYASWQMSYRASRIDK